jgi:molybdate/tungstate transport system substrate-binding protein
MRRLSRRETMIQGGRLLVGASLLTLFPASRALAEGVVEVAYAGSMTSVMEGPIKEVLGRQLGIEMRGRAQGASGLASLIASGTIRPDVFISITPSPMQVVLDAKKAEAALALARTEMVIAFSPTGRFAPQFRQAQRGKGRQWWQILEDPEIRFGRTDPVTDPQGRNIIFVMELAARLYRRPDLVERVLGQTINPAQIFTESSVEARLQSSELDAASAYKIQPGPFQIPYLELPSKINLREPVKDEGEEINVVLGGKLYYPEPLIYYAAPLGDAQHPKQAAAFMKWIAGEQAQAIFRAQGYDPPGKAPGLHS